MWNTQSIMHRRHEESSCHHGRRNTHGFHQARHIEPVSPPEISLPDHVKRAHDNAFKPFDPEYDNEGIKQEDNQDRKKKKTTENQEVLQETEIPPPPSVS